MKCKQLSHSDIEESASAINHGARAAVPDGARRTDGGTRRRRRHLTEKARLAMSSCVRLNFGRRHRRLVILLVQLRPHAAGVHTLAAVSICGRVAVYATL